LWAGWRVYDQNGVIHPLHQEDLTMTLTRFRRTPATVLAALGLAAAVTTAFGAAATPKFLPDDPIQIERDTEDASAMKPLEVNLFVDFAYNVLTGRGSFAPVRARNLNTVDEVPDSSWFTNRAGAVALTPDDLRRGPNTGDGPVPGPWTITSSKSDGVTPGFTVKDPSGQRWFLKFDPPGFRGMSTGTEVAVTKLMWALGFHVPENYIAYLRREQLVVGSGAKYTPAGAKQRPMRPGDIDQLLKRADREPNGSYRVVASKALEGKPIGRIRFMGTRPDDPNDIVSHEDRRELRGYGTFAAWLNHVDVKAINSLDMLVTTDAGAFVRHNLIDFGSALGSGGVGAADYWEGAQYLVDPGSAARQIAGLGFVFPNWHTTPFYESSSIGRLPLHNHAFDPERWKPRLPNRAFLEARLDDKFWAAQKLVALTTDLIRAAVQAGEFGDTTSEEFLVRALAERRDAIARAYLVGINPIVRPTLSSEGVLAFGNAAVDADVARIPDAYRAVWFRFDNATAVSTLIGETSASIGEMRAPAPLSSRPGTLVRVALSASSTPHPSWATPVDAYFMRIDAGWKLVGFERMPEKVRLPNATN
jgi:hypothetical protein